MHNFLMFVMSRLSYFSGKMTVEDVANDQLDDMEITLSWTGNQPKNSIFPVIKKILADKDMKGEIIKKMVSFENAFKQI